PGAPDFPRWVGESNLGFVKGVGREVTKFSIGDRVVTRYPHQSEYIANDDEMIVRVPKGIHPEDAVYAHLYTLSALCYRKAFFSPGENVAIVGLGVLGLGAVGLGPCFGANTIGIANSPVRMEMAKKMGAHATFLSDDPDLKEKLDVVTDGAGIDLVILTANPWPAYRTAVDIVRGNGRVAIVALPGRGEEPLDFNPLAMQWFYMKGISLIAVNGGQGYLYPPPAEDRFGWDQVCRHTLSLMKDGRLEPKRLITHRMNYKAINKAYEMIYRREKNMMGVVFDWND
ncbi:MAG: zinc-binding alcohol dehydrogenase, partial [Gemmatimonadota bacterium]|nr:zinc-binding alcohol dehydrogenase [Gemmatimonadota bacterium]